MTREWIILEYQPMLMWHVQLSWCNERCGDGCRSVSFLHKTLYVCECGWCGKFYLIWPKAEHNFKMFVMMLCIDRLTSNACCYPIICMLVLSGWRWLPGWVWPRSSNSDFRSFYPPLNQQRWTLCAQLWYWCALICSNRQAEPLQQG